MDERYTKEKAVSEGRKADLLTEVSQVLGCSERTVRRLLSEGKRQEQKLTEFESAWRSGTAPKISDFLPAEGKPNREEFLQELVKLDLEYRWRLSSGDQATDSSRPECLLLEDYVQRLPELGALESLPLDLIAEEFRVRMRWDDHPALDEYERRFPEQREALLERLDRIHDDMAAEQDLEPSPKETAEPRPKAKFEAPTKLIVDPSPKPSREPPASGSKFEQKTIMKETQALTSQASVQTGKGTVTESKYTTRADPRKGGMAVVWKAYDSMLHRQVAFKELRLDRADELAFREMFMLEAQVTGQLEHPNIAPVYELGADPKDNRPFYTMKYVRGKTLRELIEEYHEARLVGEEDSLALPRLLNMFSDVCNAIAYAHSRGVIHRDIKPQNIMVESFGEVLVLDWGLAKFIGTNESHLPPVKLTQINIEQTEAGVRKGTPAYWAPEQAEGKAELLDVRTDIYGLGGVLYEILTGHPPHAGQDDHFETVSKEPRHPRALVPTVSAPLDAICAKALAADRDKRYSSVSKLKKDLESWFVDETVDAYKESLIEKVRRSSRRNRMATMLAAFGCIAFLFVIVLIAIDDAADRADERNSELKHHFQFATMQAQELESNVDNLRQDVTFLANLKEIEDVLSLQRPQSPTATSGSNNAGPGENQSKAGGGKGGPNERAEQIFERFLREKPNYMQVRVLGVDGKELVRVDRSTPGAPPTIETELQKKDEKPYFRIPMAKGDWYLSEIELNQERGKKQKDLPVIRGAMPVFLENDGDPRPAGLVVINLHFHKLVEALDVQSQDGTIYLTDDDGRFIYHPHPDVSFCFERKLDYQIKELYPEISENWDDHLTTPRVCQPRTAVHFKPKGLDRLLERSQASANAVAKPKSDNNASDKITNPHGSSQQVDQRPTPEKRIARIYEHWTSKIESATVDVMDEFEGLRCPLSTEADGIMFGLEEEELAAALVAVERKLGTKLEARWLPAKGSDDVSHTAYLTKLPLEMFGEMDEERSLGLVQVMPRQQAVASRLFGRLRWPLLFVILVTGVLIYLSTFKSVQRYSSKVMR